MQTNFQVIDLQELPPEPVGEVRQWFQKHPTVQSCFPKDLDTGIMEKIMRFMGRLELYLEDEHYNKDLTVNRFASMLKCSKALVWLWIHSEDVSDEEVLERIVKGANVFHQKAGFCFVYHPNKCKQDIGLIDTAIRISYRDLQLPRQIRELLLSKRENVPSAEVPPTNDE